MTTVKHSVRPGSIASSLGNLGHSLSDRLVLNVVHHAVRDEADLVAELPPDVSQQLEAIGYEW